jgi:hypothetical protein
METGGFGFVTMATAEAANEASWRCATRISGVGA